MPGSDRTNSEKLSILLSWFEENKVTYNEEALEVVEQKVVKRGSNIVSVDGFGIVARRNLEEEEPLVVIPKSAVISAATSALANIFFDEDLGGSLALCIAVMYEISLGKESPWYGYLQSLPQRADIPMLWDSQARGWLRGTGVSGWIERDEQNLKEDFEGLQKLVADYPLIFVSQNDIDWKSSACFLDVASLVSSRAFMVDVHRGNSMVPFADIFNHKTAGENVHIESEEMVCPLCGEAFGCEHMDGLENMDAEEENDDDDDNEQHSDEDDEDEDHEAHGHVDHDDCSDCGDCGDDEEDSDENSDSEEMGEELPMLVDEAGIPIEEEEHAASGNEDSEQEQDSEDDGFEDEDSEDGDGSDDEDDEDKYIDSLDMVVFKPCRANSEVFNTYGDHGSAYLLHRYGFCDTQNPFESVALDSEDVMQAFAVAVSEKRASEVAELIARFRDLFVPNHRAKNQKDEDEEESDDEDDKHNEDDGEDEDGDVPMLDDDDEVSEADDMPIFTIDAPGHPNINLVALLVLGLADESVFSQVSQSDSVFRHYFPIMRRFWGIFQDKLDGGAPVSAAFREANKESAVKKASVALVCRAAFMLAEKRLLLLGEDAVVLGTKPTNALQLSRWESAKQLRSNEKKILQQCIKTYKKAVAKLSA
ncbi:hypothetical protein GGF37_001788 [Kickxella alabastrina]|nr:hypothetical protein GGF37_001788 [Kickxella alabastrina]